ncbi:MAG: DNA-processing protein DprA [Anaerolineae bacterium]
MKTLKALLSHFGNDPQAILNADEKSLQEVPGIGPKITRNIKTIDIKLVEKAIMNWKRTGVRALPFYDDDYPPRLRLLDDAPPTIFVRGKWNPNPSKTVAIVGTRQPTEIARKFAQNLSTLLVEQGHAIISGMAIGIDSAAHFGALIQPQGYTFAVLGCGVNRIYPPEHERLANVIMQRGAILSEINPSNTTSPSQLVARNRIISGLSDALVVVETEIDGGAMYAARFAGQQGKPIFTVESPSSGNRFLIDNGVSTIDWDLKTSPF